MKIVILGGKTQENSQLLLSCFLPLRVPDYMMLFLTTKLLTAQNCPYLSLKTHSSFVWSFFLFHPLEGTNPVNSDGNLENTVTVLVVRLSTLHKIRLWQFFGKTAQEDVCFLYMARTPTKDRNLDFVSSSVFVQTGTAPCRKRSNPQVTDTGCAAEVKMQTWCSLAQQVWPFVLAGDGIALSLPFGQFLRG